MSGVEVEATPIEGMWLVTSPVHRDRRGWFTQAWSASDLAAHEVGLAPVQHNLSLNVSPGTTRGFHAEPWNKLVTVASGQVFAAWVDLRTGADFGRCWWHRLEPGKAVLVPRGVANAFQALDPGTVYSYLVDAPWRPPPPGGHPAVDLADPRLAVPWPIDLDRAVLSPADERNPPLGEVAPLPRPRQGRSPRPGRTIILGATGQLGRALQRAMPDAVALNRQQADLGRPGWSAQPIAGLDWEEIDTVVNAAAWTDVDAAESGTGRSQCWQVNALAVAELVQRAQEHGVQVVQLSTDYVFDGRRSEHPEDEPVSPLGVYGATKAAAEALVATLPRHLVVRTSWLVGDKPGFVSAMAAAARAGRAVQVVDDQVGRFTFVDELAAAIGHLLAGEHRGTFHVTAAGEALDRAGLARRIFELVGADPEAVTPVSTQAYAAGAQVATRPRHSTLDLGRLRATGFSPRPWDEQLAAYLREH